MGAIVPGTSNNQAAVLEKVVVEGDLSKLSPAERMAYYRAVCESLGLNPMTRPFEYVMLQGKLTLYARKDAAEQLRSIRGISLTITDRQRIEDVYVVTARGTDRTGRVDESTGAVSVGGLKGDNLANAMMKAETKAKRRVTLSLAGLGLLDETELDTIKDARRLTEADLAQPQARMGFVVEPPEEEEEAEEAASGQASFGFDVVPTDAELYTLASTKGVYLKHLATERYGVPGLSALTDPQRVDLYNLMQTMPDKAPRR